MTKNHLVFASFQLIRKFKRIAESFFGLILRSTGLMQAKQDVPLAAIRSSEGKVIAPATSAIPAPALELRDGTVLSHPWAILTSERRLVGSLCRQMGRQIRHHPAFRTPFRPPDMVVTDTPVIMAGYHSGRTYFHWMIEILPRLEMAKALFKSDFPNARIVLDRITTSFQQESLAALSIDSNRLISREDFTSLKASLLLIPPLAPREGDGLIPTAEFLRRTFLRDRPLPSPRQKRIYISRSQAPARRLMNEPELLESLIPLGFEKVSFEGLSIQEQAAIMADADSVIAPHGAGLTNLVFAKAGTHVIELHSPVFLNRCYEKMSDALQLRHQNIPGSRCLNNTHLPEHADYEVDVSIVLQACSRLPNQPEPSPLAKS